MTAIERFAVETGRQRNWPYTTLTAPALWVYGDRTGYTVAWWEHGVKPAVALPFLAEAYSRSARVKQMANLRAFRQINVDGVCLQFNPPVMALRYERKLHLPTFAALCDHARGIASNFDERVQWVYLFEKRKWCAYTVDGRDLVPYIPEAEVLLKL